MKAARIVEVNKPLQVQQLESPEPTESQVLVKVHSAGVCHSDIHLWEGGYVGPEGQFIKTTDRGIRYPLTPGHEIAGTIEGMGNEAKGRGFENGDKVLVYPWIGEGLCPACRAGDENLCDNPQSLGLYLQGGYAEYVFVPSYRYLISIGRDGSRLDLDAASTLSCSALTAYGAVRNASLTPNDNVVVVGAGGLGLMAIQLAKAISGARVIALDVNDEKLSVAKDNGADAVVNSKHSDAAKAVIELTGGLGADAVLDFVNASATAAADMRMLRKRGRVVFVGLFGGELKLGLVSMPTRAYRLIGSYTGNLMELVELVSLAKRGVIKPVISHRFKLEQVTDALTMLKEGRITGRAVINPSVS